MDFFNKYRTDGMGLHTFLDKEDQKQYLYTQFEPQKANYVFPNFDQPDLKATWLLKAIVPQDWTLISSEMEN